MSPPPTNIDGTDITGATIDGQEVQEITIDGQTVFDGRPTIIDNAEDSPDGPYGPSDDVTTYYSGNTGALSRTSSNAISGLKSLDISTGANSYIGSVAGDGLPSYPSYGDVLSFKFEVPQSNWNIDLFYSTSSNSSRGEGYGIALETDNNSIGITVIDGGGPVSTFGSSSFSFSANQVYTVIFGVRDSSGNDEHFYELYEK